MYVCKRCGKRLKTEKSIQRGYGPVCYKKSKKYLRLRDYYAD